MRKLYSFVICLLMTLGYPYVVALILPNTIVMPAMDHQCYLSNDTSFVNYYNVSEWLGDSEDAIFGNFAKLIKQHPKMRYRIKEICGDYYYEEMGFEETIEKVFIRPSTEKCLKNQKEID